MQKLGEIAEISTGFPFDGHKYTSIGIRVVRGENIGQGELHWEEKVDKRWNESTSALDNYWLYEGDIVMQMDGNVGKNIARIYTADPMLIAQRVACIRAKVKCSQDYIYGILRTKLFKNYIERCATGTSIKHISLQQISDFEFDFHLPEIQAKLGRIIADIDDKIRVNRQINDNLEAMAKQLYDYWFVQFDFPNEEGKPYKSSGGAMVWNEKLKREIPQGWIASNYTDLFTIGNGQTMPQNEGFIPAYGGNGIVKMVEISNYPACIIIGRVGANCGSIHYSKVPCWVSDNAISVCSKNDDWQPFLFYSFRLYNLSKNKGGSSQPLITHEALKHLYFPMSEKHINQFCHIVNELQDLIYSNQQEILKLTKLRDELLPLLMNGQASVNYHLSVFYTKR